MLTANIALYVISMVVLVWSSLTVYLSYYVYSEFKEVSLDIQNFAIACIVIGVLFVLIFVVYAYNRSQNASQKLVLGFKWYDAMVLFILLGWCAMTIAMATIVLQYQQKYPDQVSDSTRSVAISTIVIAIVVLLQFITYLYIQEQVPTWCDEYAKVQEQQMERLKRLDPRLRSTLQPEEATTRSAGQQIIVMPAGAEIATSERKPSTVDRYL